jgi:hypothetical protein
MELSVQAPTPPGAEATRRSVAKGLVLGALGVFSVALAGLGGGVEPFSSWFFVFAWWSYIFALDGLTYLRRGSSILLTRPRAFFLLLPWSTAFWLFFELINLRLENWYYVGLPEAPLSRYLGIFVSFATVLPGIFETADFIGTFGTKDRLRCKPEIWRVTARRRQVMTGIGVLFLVLPLVFPRYCYPLIWGATFFLLEPWLAQRNQTSIWSHLAEGRPGLPLRIFLAGAICGLCWETWNFWASAKWIYTVPFFEELKLFEMPVLGFLGFPPFALECYTFSRFLVALGWIPEWEPEMARRCVSRRRQHSWAIMAVLVSLPAILAVDQLLVRSTKANREDFSEVESFQLARVALMGERGVAWLSSIHVNTIAQLAAMDSNTVENELSRSGRGPGVAPRPAEIRYWLRSARQTQASLSN